MNGPLIEAGRLRERLGEPGLVVVDCRWRLGQRGAGEPSYEQGHIPGAVFMDVDRDLAAPPGPGGRHPLPAPADFERAARAAGIAADSCVVAYDDAELGGAARLWWLLRYFGHQRAAVLNGGLAAWVETGGELETGPASAGVAAGEPAAGVAADGPEAATAPACEPFRARPREGALADAEELLARGADPLLVLLDARAAERYRGEVEPIDAVAGHVPGAVNLPFAALAPAGRYGSPEELRGALEAAGADPDRELVAYCGSGVSACTLLLAAEAAGLSGGRLYAGSWSEWAGRGLPVGRGAGGSADG